MATVELFDPLKLYNSTLQKEYRDSADKIYDELVVKSGINVEENRETVRNYYKTYEGANKLRKSLNGFKALRVLLIIFGSLIFVAGILVFLIPFVFNKDAKVGACVGVGVALAVVGIAMFVLALTVVKNAIHKRAEALKHLDALVAKLKATAEAQMAPLNALFDWNAPSETIKKTTPIIDLDPYLDIQKLEYLSSKYGFGENTNPNYSTVATLSGDILGNPFFLYRTYYTAMYDHVYEGSLVITYTERVSDGKGGSYTVTRTQTLRATVTKPAPGYYLNTKLVYGNDAAPKLHFSRQPNVAANLTDKQVEHIVKKGKKKIAKIAEQALLDKDPSTNFTAMGNEKFDVLFNAVDRDNEVEFRLLYTPVAQLSTVSLLLSSKPYGDDFSFKKDGPLNYIESRHSADFDYSTSPDRYQTFSVDESRVKFVNYNANFIQGLYFDLAPLLCIPLYQQHKPREYIYKDVFKANYSTYEEEVLANSIDGKAFKNPKAITNQILKILDRTKVGGSDAVTVRSHAYSGINHTTFVPVMGRDGKLHQVPVNWIEYIPVTKDTKMIVKKSTDNRTSIDNLINKNEAFKKVLNQLSSNFCYQRGLCGFVLKSNYGVEEDKELSALFGENAK